MTCRDFVEFLADYYSGDLAAPERTEFEAHLAACPDCVEYLGSYQKTIHLGKEAFGDAEDQLPDQVPDDLVRAILAARAKRNADHAE